LLLYEWRELLVRCNVGFFATFCVLRVARSSQYQTLCYLLIASYFSFVALSGFSLPFNYFELLFVAISGSLLPFVRSLLLAPSHYQTLCYCFPALSSKLASSGLCIHVNLLSIFSILQRTLNSFAFCPIDPIYSTVNSYPRYLLSYRRSLFYRTPLIPPLFVL